MNMASLAKATLLVLGTSVASAVGASAECLDASQDFGMARAAAITDGQPRIYFVQGADHAGCPNATAACRARAYVVPGDVVVLTATRAAYSCATLTNSKGGTTSNWLPTASTTPLVPAPPSIEDWVGHWRTGEQDITITRAMAGELAIKGTATYGANDPDRVRRGAVNSGEIEAVANPRNGLVAFTVGDNGTLPYDQGAEENCRLKMQVRGPYLIAVDSTTCGGMGVSFSGFYRRLK